MVNYKKKKLSCEECGEKMLGIRSRRFCDNCRKKRKSEVDKKLRQKNNLKYRQKNDFYTQRTHSRGKELAKKINNVRLADFCNKKVNARVSVSFSIPFKTGMSKNFYLGLRHGGYGVYKKAEAVALEELIILKTKKMGGKFKQNKIWLDFYVEKPTNRSDAVNVVDLICDAVKKGIGVDDRWFSLGQVDWSVVKDREPQVYVRVYQEDVWDSRVCALCGRILPEACFGNKKNNNCKECSKKDYAFTDEDLAEMIKNTWTLEGSDMDRELSERDELEIQKCLTYRRIYGEES